MAATWIRPIIVSNFMVDQGGASATTSATTITVSPTSNQSPGTTIVVSVFAALPGATGVFGMSGATSATSPTASSSAANYSSGSVGVTGDVCGSVACFNKGTNFTTSTVITATFSLACTARSIHVFEFSNSPGSADSGGGSAASGASTAFAVDAGLNWGTTNVPAVLSGGWSAAATISGLTAGWTTGTQALGVATHIWGWKLANAKNDLVPIAGTLTASVQWRGLIEGPPGYASVSRATASRVTQTSAATR